MVVTRTTGTNVLALEIVHISIRYDDFSDFKHVGQFHKLLSVTVVFPILKHGLSYFCVSLYGREFRPIRKSKNGTLELVRSRMVQHGFMAFHRFPFYLGASSGDYHRCLSHGWCRRG